jgi:repressor LexA
MGKIPDLNRTPDMSMQQNDTRKHSIDATAASAPQANTQGAYTAKQGQYLAFIYYYTKIHRRSPAEADIQGFFQVSPPVVHQMIMNLEKLGYIEKTPGQGRSIKLLLAREQLPDLL